MAQSAAGHDCQGVCLFEAGAMVTELAAAGVPVITCNKRDGADLRAVLRMRRAIASHGTEVLHSHNGIAHYYATLAALGLGVRRVVNTRHGMGCVKSEEHTSELQSLMRISYAVFCLKNKK